MRDRSMNYRAFEWLLLREAAYTITMTPIATQRQRVALKVWLANQRTDRLTADMERIAKLWPARMVRP